ncbi:MAG: acetate--CoA ligase [Candidatus Bathyarchaeota archaeon]|jgi:acetyl-CoA synthetase|nr:acetate--CoA ligase [Candidatus Bathyarchaeota archaeon]
MSEDTLAALPVDEKFEPNQKLRETWKASIADPDAFWAEEAKQLDWFKSWNRVLEWEDRHARWFNGGKLNASYNCLDRHVATAKKNKVAYIWEGEPGDKRVITYGELYREVNKFASALKELGVKEGTFVAMYMPMIPELPVAMLACARLGAPFTQVYSGFSVKALSERIRSTEAEIIITADGVFRRNKVIDLKGVVDKSADQCPSVRKVITVERTKHGVEIKPDRDIWYHDAIAEAKEKYVEPVPVNSSHILYVLYTSGTTAKPKGVQVCTGGYLTFTASTLKWAFDVKDEDVWWCFADVGWVTGHSYIVFAPLVLGLTSVMYEGAPDTPDPGRTWRMIESYEVNKFYTSPTLLRLLMKFGDEIPAKSDLSSLEILGTVGEPINPEVWRWYYRVIGKKRCPIIDTWWQTETGGFMIAPAPGIQLLPLKAGSATFPMPGIDPIVVNEDGDPVPAGEKGYMVIRKPWPGMLMTLYKDDQRYLDYYWNRYPNANGYRFYTGDYAVQDKDGYYWLLGRSDDVLKVAGHRLGTIELEDALVSHPAVAEASVVGIKDPIKMEVPIGLVILRVGKKPSPKLAQELRLHVRKVIGPLATPAAIYFVRSMPKTRSGKIMRRVIKAIVEGEAVGDTSTLEDQAAVEEVRRVVESSRADSGLGNAVS